MKFYVIAALVASSLAAIAFAGEKTALRKPASGSFGCMQVMGAGTKYPRIPTLHSSKILEQDMDNYLKESCNLSKPFSVFEKAQGDEGSNYTGLFYCCTYK